jgi:alkanesulfonate monooxygenase SsuD/methylene tetrahydromethanopterin reductase-like flavin-dependent oxidoreductase (luciferase family)
MLSGQDGLTWERWRHILALSERLAIASCFLTDHYFIRLQKESLEPFLAFVLAATETRRIRFGPLVTPVTFRRPVEVGRMAAQIDRLSGDRFVLGLGAGWTEAEHIAYGLPFPPLAERFDRLDEAVQLIQHLWQPGPATFDGQYFQLQGADCRPKPAPGRPPILIGGNGERRTIPLVAQRADEWNALNLTPEQYAAKLDVFHRHCDVFDRDPVEIRRSMTVYGLVGPTPQIVDQITSEQSLVLGDTPPDDLDQYRRDVRANGIFSGSTDEVIDYLGRLADLGLHEIVFRHFLFDVDDVPEYLSADIAPALADL